MSETEQQAPPPAAGNSSGISAEERQWAMFAHLSALLGGLITTGWAAGLGCIIGPLVIWQVKKDSMPFVADQALEALNFNITVAGIMLILLAGTVGTLGIGALVTVPLMGLLGLVALVFIIIAAIKAHEGVRYRYPFAVRLVK